MSCTRVWNHATWPHCNWSSSRRWKSVRTAWVNPHLTRTIHRTDMDQLHQSAHQSALFITVPPPSESMEDHLGRDGTKSSSGGVSLVENRTPLSLYDNMRTSRPFSTQMDIGDNEFTHDIPPAMLGTFHLCPLWCSHYIF
jgi:hypothetical protein